jgi:sec-independent protein translocase protein TatA
MDALAPWHIILLVVVLLVLFGSKKLPGAARALGESMRIFKAETKGLHDDNQPTDGTTSSPMSSVQQQPVAQQLTPSSPVPDATAQQVADLQRQIQDLQRQNVGAGGAPVNGAPLSEAQPNQQPF